VELLSNVMVCWGFLILYILKIKLGTYTSLIGVKLGEDQRTNTIKVYKISDCVFQTLLTNPHATMNTTEKTYVFN
jgi:hypothetical protein